MTDQPKELGTAASGEFEVQVETGDYWVLNIPGTDQHIMLRDPEEPGQIVITFASERDALAFKAQNNVPENIVPRFIPKVLQ